MWPNLNSGTVSVAAERPGKPRGGPETPVTCADLAAGPTRRFDALVLNASLRQSLVTVRSLGRRGISVAALDNSSSVPAFSSRWCQRGFVCPTDLGTEAYLAY